MKTGSYPKYRLRSTSKRSTERRRCLICGFKFKSTFVLNEHIHKEHPLPRRVQNFGNFRIHNGEVEFSDSEDDEDKDYERHRAEETEVSGSDDDEGTEDEEEDDYEMQRHKETEDAEDEEGVEEEAEYEEIGQEQAPASIRGYSLLGF